MLIIFLFACTDINMKIFNLQLITSGQLLYYVWIFIHTYVCQCMHSCIYEHVGVYMIVNLKNIKRINILTYAHCLFPCVNKKYVHIMHINLYTYICTYIHIYT